MWISHNYTYNQLYIYHWLIKSINPKGNQSWIFTGRTDAEAEAPILWPSDAKSWLIGKDPDAGKHGRQEQKRTTENEMVGWHHQLDEHELEQASGVGDGQGSLACCSPLRCKESDTTERLNWLTDTYIHIYAYIPSLLSLSPCSHSTLLGRHRAPGWFLGRVTTGWVSVLSYVKQC